MAELDRLKESDVVRVIDGIAVHKDKNGEVKVIERSDLSDEENAEFGAYVGALIGTRRRGLGGAEVSGGAGADALQEPDESDGDEIWDVLDEIRRTRQPQSSCWSTAGPFRSETLCGSRRLPGLRRLDPSEDLVAIGMIAAEDAAAKS